MDDAASAGTGQLRDNNADSWARIFRATQGLRSAGHLYLHRVAVTSSITIDESANNGTFYDGDATLGGITLSLVASVNVTDKVLIFGKYDVSANAITIDAFGSELIGTALTAILANPGDVIAIIGNGAQWRILWRYSANTGVVYASQQDSTTITNTTSETTFDQNVTIPANSLRVGDVFDINQAGVCTNTNSTDTLNVKSDFGSANIASTGALDVATGDAWAINLKVTIRAIGASGFGEVTGNTFIGTPGTANYKPVTPATFSIDTTTTNVIKATGTWSVANASDVVKQTAHTVERKPLLV
jgi:hypothetical protein